MNEPPHNPRLRDLIANKRQSSYRQTPKDGRLGFRGWHERGRLPHFDAPGRTQFVTFRLADCFPESQRSEWEQLLQIETDSEQRLQLEDYLDRGYGTAHLKQPAIGTLVENALRFFDGDRYVLRAWVVMPNHVHVLFAVGKIPMAEIVESWKSFTAKAANKLLGRTGRFWEPDYWDTFMRNDEHCATTVRYIESNPTKAKLVREPKEWPWCSARLRDEFGRLSAGSAPVPGAAAGTRVGTTDNSNAVGEKLPLRPGGPRSGGNAVLTDSEAGSAPVPDAAAGTRVGTTDNSNAVGEKLPLRPGGPRSGGNAVLTDSGIPTSDP